MEDIVSWCALCGLSILYGQKCKIMLEKRALLVYTSFCYDFMEGF